MSKKKVYCKNCQSYGVFIDACLIWRTKFSYVKGKQAKLMTYNPYKKNKNGDCKDYKIIKRLPQFKSKHKWYQFWVK